MYGFLRIAIAKFPGPTQDFRTPMLVLAAVGLVYGSLLAFRAPDVRGVIAYSSLAQMGLITLGLFAANDLGFDGAVLQMVNHGLISATLFLLAGAIERRTATGEFLLLGGMARGRPALATLLMTTGVIALAVPGSSAFAGEFLVLAGVFQQYWLYGVVGAVAIVLAAMYVLRLISACCTRTSARLFRTRPGTWSRLSWRSSCRSSPACLRSRSGRRRSPSIPSRPASSRSAARPSAHRRRGHPRCRTGRCPAKAGSCREDRDAAGRLADALARAVAARRGRVLPHARRARSRNVAPSARRVLRVRRVHHRGSLRGRPVLPKRERDARGQRCHHARPSQRARRDHHLRQRTARGVRVYGHRMRKDYVAEYYALVATAGAGCASCSRRTT